ncbi:hypothetical protein GCM10028775_47450 [Catellatospora paridis]
MLASCPPATDWAYLQKAFDAVEAGGTLNCQHSGNATSSLTVMAAVGRSGPFSNDVICGSECGFDLGA